MTSSVVVRGTRPGRRLAPVGWAAMALAVLALVVIGLTSGQWPGGIDRSEDIVPGWFLIAIPCAGVGIFWLTLVVSMIGRSGTLRVTPDRELRLSWRARPIRVDGEITFGRWTEIAPVHTDKGVVAFIPSDNGVLRIAGEDHDGSGYRLDEPATAKFDVRLPRAAFDQLLEALGTSQDHRDYPLIHLTPQGTLRMMAPWLLTIVVVGTIGIVMGNTKLGEGMIIAAIAAGLLWTFVALRRPPKTKLALELRPDELVLAGTRVPWHSVSATPRTKVLRSRYATSRMAVLELKLGDQRPIRVGCFTREVPWLARRTYRRVRYLVGEPHWHNLVEALETHDRVSPPAPV